MMKDNTNSQDAMNAAIYARSAVLDPASIKRQIEACRAGAARMNMTVLAEHTYIDAGISGNTLVGRAGINALFDAAETAPRPFYWVLVDDISRIARNLAVAIGALRQLHDLGVAAYVVNLGCNSRDEQFVAKACIAAPFDQYFLDSARTRRAKKK